jgi:hypothetical protein
VLSAEFARLWVEIALLEEFIPVSIQDILQRCGAGFVKTYVEVELWHLRTSR